MNKINDYGYEINDYGYEINDYGYETIRNKNGKAKQRNQKLYFSLFLVFVSKTKRWLNKFRKTVKLGWVYFYKFWIYFPDKYGFSF